ncbi:MAG: hypothetical protein M3Z84_05805, partial [Actinomycetota bacterium]|nr:hypothetical protein [Actinomycetota bacterium]
KAKTLWNPEPDEHDYPAAVDYLSLLLPQREAEGLAQTMRKAPTVRRKAKDLLRASRLPLLPADDVDVAKDLKRVKRGSKLSPVLLVRGGLAADRPLTIADGYHRICAGYHLSEDQLIPCRVVDLAAK